MEEFFSEFHHRELKAIGFKKVRHTFSRDQETYIERFNFQGSAWNSSSEKEPWLFYIKVGVKFKDLPARKPCADLPKTHWHQRIEHIAYDASKSYSLYFPVDIKEVSSKLLTDLNCASDNLAENIEKIRELYLANDRAVLLTKVSQD